MTNQTPNEIDRIVQAVAAQMQTQPQAQNMPAMPQMQAPMMPAMQTSMAPMGQMPQMGMQQNPMQNMGMANIPAPIGWMLPIEVQIQGMQGPQSVTLYLQFSHQYFSQYQQIIAALQGMGYQVRGYAKQQGGFGGGGYGNSYGQNSYGGNRYSRYGRRW